MAGSGFCLIPEVNNTQGPCNAVMTVRGLIVYFFTQAKVRESLLPHSLVNVALKEIIGVLA